MDRWKWVVIDVGVILDTPASHSENFFFRHFSELGGGPLGQTLGCHQNFDIFGATLGRWRATQPGYEQISSQPQETIVKSEPLMPEACLGNNTCLLYTSDAADE